MRNMALLRPSNKWEELRKQASQVENDIYLKLVSFSKLGASYSQHGSLTGTRAEGSGSAEVGGESSGRVFETMSLEIEQLMNKLTEINDAMQEYINDMTETSPTPTMLHMLQRHRDILRNYSQEFSKTKTNIKACREREDLLGSVRRDISDYKASTGGLNRRTDLYLKENEHLRKYFS
jgi:Golgi SNAP receptor complex protein 1